MALCTAIPSLTFSCLSAKASDEGAQVQSGVSAPLVEEIVVTANRSAQSWRLAQQSISLLTESEIQQTGATHINEIGRASCRERV